ncbi:MAG: hypothetical protein HON70_03045, partial [Lentisphaerae bacterium]|nr:hypothetical protein [Lentisphaerota bacterium]
MSGSLFRQGGRYRTRKTGPHEYTMKIPLPGDQEGRTARECPRPDCSPGYFKVKFGTGITEAQSLAFCPYCRRSADPGDFATREQARYAKDIMMREAHEGIERMMKDALGLGSSGRRKLGGGLFSIEMSYKPGTRPHVRRPFEEELQRAVVCPNCGLDHAVFGLATWCPDCGGDIFMTHVDAEHGVIRKMLGDVERRRTDFGARIAARDIENCLEDTVSVFEAVLKALVVRHLRENGTAEDEVHEILRKRIRNSFQNVHRAQTVAEKVLGVPLFAAAEVEVTSRLAGTFEKRHPITHNLGVVDRKYVENALSAEREGREIRVTVDEVE